MSLARTVAVAAIAMIGTSAVAADKPKVVTTFTVIADMAENVAGDHAEVVSITKPGAEIPMGRMGTLTLDDNNEGAMADPFVYDSSNIDDFKDIF